MMLMVLCCLVLSALHTLGAGGGAPRVLSVGAWVYISRICVGGWVMGTEESWSPEVSGLLAHWGAY